ncbi:MAG: cold shock domain-containing protein CspD [Pseudomonadales bacterium]
MATGKVKWFNNAKGYGFILPEGGGEDLFAHYSSIQMEGYKTLKAGQEVEYELHQGPKGFHAVNIRATDVPGAAPELANGSGGAAVGTSGGADMQTARPVAALSDTVDSG